MQHLTSRTLQQRSQNLIKACQPYRDDMRTRSGTSAQLDGRHLGRKSCHTLGSRELELRHFRSPVKWKHCKNARELSSQPLVDSSFYRHGQYDVLPWQNSGIRPPNPSIDTQNYDCSNTSIQASSSALNFHIRLETLCCYFHSLKQTLAGPLSISVPFGRGKQDLYHYLNLFFLTVSSTRQSTFRVSAFYPILSVNSHTRVTRSRPAEKSFNLVGQALGIRRLHVAADPVLKPVKHETEKPILSAKEQWDGKHRHNNLMSSAQDTNPNTAEPAQHKPLVVGLKKPQANVTTSTTMASAEQVPNLNEEIQRNVAANTASEAPAEGGPEKPKKKEKAPKQPKPPKPAATVAPVSPALIDLRVGHILRAIAHPNADSLYVSTIAMGDPEGTENTQVDEETGKIVRTVCSGLRAYIPLEQMQNRKVVVVANLKPVNMRSIKSAAMVLAASPKPEEGADPHAPDRSVELVDPPTGSEAGDKVYFEGWPYGEGKGPEKVLNPKKKQWEAIQPGFFTSESLTVEFDAGLTEEVSGSDKGELIVEGKGKCTVPSLKGAIVR